MNVRVFLATGMGLLGGCFSEAGDLSSGAASIASSSVADTSGSADDGMSVSTNATSDEDSPTSANDVTGDGNSSTASSDVSTSTGVASRGDDSDPSTLSSVSDSQGESGSMLQPYGGPCQSDDACESGMCFGDGNSGTCTVACDATAGGCQALGIDAFCVNANPSPDVCDGHLNTGNDDQDGVLLADGRIDPEGDLEDGDIDAYYFETPAIGDYGVSVYPSADLDVVISLYAQGEYQFGRNDHGEGSSETMMWESSAELATYPTYPVVLVSAVPGTSGSYTISRTGS